MSSINQRECTSITHRTTLTHSIMILRAYVMWSMKPFTCCYGQFCKNNKNNQNIVIFFLICCNLWEAVTLDVDIAEGKSKMFQKDEILSFLLYKQELNCQNVHHVKGFPRSHHIFLIIFKFKVCFCIFLTWLWYHVYYYFSSRIWYYPWIISSQILPHNKYNKYNKTTHP